MPPTRRRLIRELMIWIALISLGLAALDYRARTKAPGAREAAERTRRLNEQRQQAQATGTVASPGAPRPTATEPQP
jgi:hypothetical protein